MLLIIRLDREEENIVEHYAIQHGISIKKAIKRVFIRTARREAAAERNKYFCEEGSSRLVSEIWEREDKQ